MASNRNIAAAAARRSPAGWPDGPASLVEVFLAVHRAQWEALWSWQRSLATCAKDCCEQWAVRYAGGVPIDG